MRYLVYSVLLLPLLILSCSHTHDYTGYHQIPSTGWSYGDIIDFKVTSPYATDSVSTGIIMVSATHDNNYEYNGLWLEVSYTPSGSAVAVRDTVYMAMCDDYGHWYGTGMPGYYQLSDTVTSRPVTLDTASVISVRHIMRVDTLMGISQVGILVQ